MQRRHITLPELLGAVKGEPRAVAALLSKIDTASINQILALIEINVRSSNLSLPFSRDMISEEEAKRSRLSSEARR